MIGRREICSRLGVDYIDACNIRRLLDFAYARGQAGRWPDQRFEHDATWTDGWLIDRAAIVAGIRSAPVFELYRQAHAAGLRSWRNTTN